MKMTWIQFFITAWCLLSTTPVTSENSEVLSIYLQKSGKPSAESYARMITAFPELENFTICYRIRLHRFREESTLMSYAVSNDMDNELRMDHRKTGCKISIHSTWAKTSYVTPFDMWSHYCITYNSYTEDWVIYVNGEQNAYGRLPEYNGPLLGGGAYIIGQEQDSLGGGFQRDQTFSGEITELNVWSRIITNQELKEVASCDGLQEGNKLAWSNITWDLHGEAEIRKLERHRLCETSYRSIVVFNEPCSLTESLRLCQVMGGTLAVPQNDEENERLYTESMDIIDYCSSGSAFLWLGANDIKIERQWVTWENKRPLTYEGPWRGDGPNGGTEENCLVMLNEQFPARWSDIACLNSYYFCAPCEFNSMVMMTLRGAIMCENSPFDNEYIVQGKRDGSPVIVGTYHSKIYWDKTKESWILTSMKEETAVLIYTPNRRKDLPIGHQTWTIQTDICNLIIGQSVNLTLSICTDLQYTCRDGSCIDLEKRCNLTPDCVDNSDEINCVLIDIPRGYIKTIPPPIIINIENVKSVEFYLNIESFPSIETQNLNFQVVMDLDLRWVDSRINFLNLKKHRSLNMISPNSIEKIWMPSLFMRNAFGNLFTNVNEGAKVEGLRQGNFSKSSHDKEEQMTIFKGSENHLKMSQHYTATYSCDFELAMFPFDLQTCNMHFTLVSAASTYMVLEPRKVKYIGKQDLIEYNIGDITAYKTNFTEYSEVTVEVSFIRRYAFYLLTLYIPSILLVVIAYSSLFFDPKDFQARTGVALTTLLVLTSLFTQTSNSLPKTSYYKLVDLWLFFSTVIIFIVILFHAMSEYYSYSMKEQSTESITRVRQYIPKRSAFYLPKKPFQPFGYPLNLFFIICGRVTIPLLYLVFNAAYWGVAMRFVSTITESDDLNGQ